MNKRAVLAFVSAATLLPNNCQARLSSNVKGQDLSSTAEVLPFFTPQGDSITPKNGNDDSNSLTVESSPGGSVTIPASFFHEDYWYSIQSLESDTTAVLTTANNNKLQQWKIHRRRKLQQQSAVEEPININSNEGENIINTDNTMEDENNHDNANEEGYGFYITNILLSLSCVMMAALAAGLTMGMLSLDPLSLEIKRRASDSVTEQQWSEQLLPLLVGHSKRHRLLVSLLLINALANEALPLFLDELLPGKYAAIIVSVTLVLFFGEIVPSAFFTGPNQVEVAAKLVPLVKAVMFVLTPIAGPIAKLLDRVLHDDDGGAGTADHGGGSSELGEDVTEGNYYNRTELSALVRIQYESQLADKRRRKQERLVLAKSLVGGVGAGGSVVVGGTAPHSLEAISSHMSKQTSASSRDSIRGSAHLTHHSIRSISKELTASSRSSRLLTPQRMPSIHADEITMIEGALAMTTKRASDVCTPLRRVYALPTDTVLDEDTKVEIWARGFSRVPVYCPKTSSLPPSDAASTAELTNKSMSSLELTDISGIVGVLLVRQLIVVESAEERPISTLPLVLPSCISPSMHLVDLINMFQAAGGRGKGGLHLAIVCARPVMATEALERGESIPKEAGVVGIITLEDVVEELLQEEIYDEADRDLELSRWGVIKWKAFVKKKKRKRLQEQERNGVTASKTTETTPLLK
ncbi:hypothetical protein ACHAXR_004384 [Thalassiosira sp. AJA248-18]